MTPSLTQSWTEVVQCSVVEFDSFVHQSSSPSLLILPVLNHLVHRNVSLTNQRSELLCVNQSELSIYLDTVAALVLVQTLLEPGDLETMFVRVEV